ncbi:MAG: hypothetical protein ACRDWE_06695 [Acidimicrobiales bacterium]
MPFDVELIEVQLHELQPQSEPGCRLAAADGERVEDGGGPVASRAR